MIRNIAFQVVPNLPGLATDSDNARGMVQHSGLVIVATIFFGFHLIHQPFDNRCNFLLDRVERAMVRAIVVTLLLQMFSLATNNSETFEYHADARDVRGWICAVIALLFHLRFWSLVFWGFFYQQLQANLVQWPRLAAVFLDPGLIEVTPDGLVAIDLNRSQEHFFSDIITEVVGLHRGLDDKIDYHGVTTTLRKICVQSLQNRLQAELDSVDFFGIKLEQAKELVESMFSDGAFKNMLLESLSFIERIHRTVSASDDDCSEREKLRRINRKQLEIEELKTFSYLSWSKVFTHRFTVQELHASMMSICNDVRDRELAQRGMPQEEESAVDLTLVSDKLEPDLEKEIKALCLDNEAMRAKLMQLQNPEASTLEDLRAPPGELTNPGDDRLELRVVDEVQDVPEAPNNSKANNLMTKQSNADGELEFPSDSNGHHFQARQGTTHAEDLSTLLDKMRAVRVELETAETSAQQKQKASKAELQKAEQNLREAAVQKQLVAAEVEAASKQLKDEETLLRSLEAKISST